MNADTGACRRRLPDDQAHLVVEVFRMLADATRVQVLWALVGQEKSVNDLAGHVGKAAPSVSQHHHLLQPGKRPRRATRH
jgi:DNA-binding transcriptional ArsR family regulator